MGRKETKIKIETNIKTQKQSGKNEKKYQKLNIRKQTKQN